MFEGVHEADLLSWLLGPWRDGGPGVCVVEGFNGIGKTSAAQKVIKAWSGPAVLVTATEDSDLESLLFAIAAKLETAGYATVADQAEGDFRLGVLELLQNNSLVIIDEFDTLLSPETRLPSRDMLSFIADVGRIGGQGRLMIITSQSLANGDWIENAAIKTMAPPTHEDAEKLLWTLLHDRGLLQEVPIERFGEIVTWLGRNPRAMQALVACLRDDPLEELIEVGAEAWELRDQGATSQMIAHLESLFLRKTIERLDPAAALLLEFLSVHRSTFTIEVITASTQHGSRPEVVKDALTSRFILGRRGAQYSLNPIARQLSLARIGQEPRRRLAAYNVAANHYVKRVHPTNDRARVRAGADFIEARYHLLQANRESEFQHLAGDYRRLLLTNYRNLEDVPSNSGAAVQVLATLMAALYDVEGGYGRLRAILAQLLVDRGGPDDDRLAYRQVSIATREARDRGSWLLRVGLAVKLDTPRAILGISDQALSMLVPETAAVVVARAAEGLVAGHEGLLALEAVNRGLGALPAANRQQLYSMAAFLLRQQDREVEAVELLLEGYREIGPSVSNSGRLFEQAAFIAFEKRDRKKINEIKSLIIERGISDHQPALCDILTYQLDEEYSQAAKLAEKHAVYFAVAAQGAFCWLVEGKRDKATDILEQTRFQANTANWWMQGIIAGCYGAWEVYSEAMCRASGRKLSQPEATAPDLWVRVWEEAPRWIGIFPAFYFPRLPAALTGLPVDLEIPRDGVSATVIYPDHSFSLDAPYSSPLEDWKKINDSSDEKGNQVSKSGDTYNIYGGAGAVGPNASVEKSEIYSVVLPAGTTSEKLIGELQKLLADLHSGVQSTEVQQAEAGLEQAIAAAQKGDEGGLVAGLKNAGKWALDRAIEIGTAIAATALQNVMGLH